MQMTKRTASIEFVADEAGDFLLAYEHPPEGEETGEVTEVLRLPFSDVRKREPAEIQRTLGRLVLAFLNSRSSRGLKLPRDLEDDKRLDEQHFSQLEAAMDAKTPEALYDMAVSLIGRGMSSDSWADVEQGEVLLDQAIATGLPAAIKYQEEVWALIRPRLEQKLKNKGPG